MTNTEVAQSILVGPAGRAIDVRQTLNSITRWTLARVGFHDLMYSTDYLKFRVTCGGRRKFWCVVKLESNDTFSVEFGRLRKFDWIVAAQLTHVYADVLGEVIENLYTDVYEG